MPPKAQMKKNNPKEKKPAAISSKETKTQSKHDILMKEILAMGGSEKDLDLLKGIDTDSESESEKEEEEEEAESKKKQIKNSTKKASKSEPVVDEPELKNEIASFMKSLFGSASIDVNMMSIEEEEEDVEEVDEDQSEGSWETEDDEEVEAEEDDEEEKDATGNESDDSGDDSMDDLPQELKELNALLDNKKRKAEAVAEVDKAPALSASSKPQKKAKTEPVPKAPPQKKTAQSVKAAQPIKAVQPAKSPTSEKNKKKKGIIADIQKEVSSMMGVPVPVPAPAPVPQKKEKDSKSKPSPKSKIPEKATNKKKSKSSNGSAPTVPVSKKATWNLGDAWSKAFEDEEDVAESNNKSKNKKANKKQQPSKKQGNMKSRK
ncbi:hypothetical protein BGZ76_001949 [Entomortierella beljakovae]|nr:hypothetical protein BGZ76_001949 [Entomortierella beljakovae]